MPERFAACWPLRIGREGGPGAVEREAHGKKVIRNAAGKHQ